MSDIAPPSPSVENVSVQACNKIVKALKAWKGDELDDLSFQAGDVITVSKKDGAGWASGSLADGTSGWFPLDCTEEVHVNAVAEIGTNTGESALDAFIKEAKEHPGAGMHLNTARLQGAVHRNHSLNEFLSSKPMQEQEATSTSAETTVEIAAAQQRLVKLQKKRKKERAEIFIENLRNGWKPENPHNLTEDQFDRLVTEVVHEIPLTREKYHFSSYDEVFTGTVLLQNLKSHAHRISPTWERGISAESATDLAQNLLERNVIVDVADPGRKKFKAKSVFQCHGQIPEYSVMNFDKIQASAEPVDGYQLSIQLLGEMIELAKKFLPNMERIRKSKQLKAFGLRMAALQQVRLTGLDVLRQKVFFINLYNTMVLYCHAKLSTPANVSDKRFMSEHCSVYTNLKRYSLQDLETEVFQMASQADIGPYFCISDCTKSTPAIFIFSEDNFQMTKLFAIRHFLNRTLIVDSSNYEVTFPKVFQRVWKDLNFKKEELVDLVAPYAAKEQRSEIEKMRSVGSIDIKFHQHEFDPVYVFEEASPLSPR